jgi:uncharacterized repeat protein (TIGR01451 family)
MKTNRNILNTGLLAVLALVLFPRIAAAQETKILHNHIPAAISKLNLRSTGQLAPDSSLHLAISLPLRNEQGLDDLLHQIYDPSSPNYRHFLTPDQFSAQFGPSVQDYEMVMNFAKVNGLSVIGTNSNRTLLDVRGRVADIEKAFKVTLQTYHHPKESRDFYAPDSDPVVNAALPIMHVSGLDNFNIPRPMFKALSLTNRADAKAEFGSGPFGSYMGNDFRAAYAPGVTLNGAGQVVGLLEYDGYFTSDILAYEAQAGLPNITLTNIAINGGVPNPGSGDPEVSLDIEMAISMATNLSAVAVYECPFPDDAADTVDLLSRMALDNLAKQMSSSWVLDDSPAFDVYYKQMAVQGQSFFQAAGDEGAFYPGIFQWADDTNITLVGGTTLSTAGPAGAWTSETVWSWYVEQLGAAAGGGGTNINGVLIPSYQQGISMTNNQGSTTLRDVPDVALTADNVYVIFDQGQAGAFGGTSCAAPLWAGFTALVNQQAVANNQRTVGFLNPAIYTIGKSANYTNCFHDITTGNNTNTVVSNQYFAAPGYDLCTGWGTPTGSNLITALLSVPTTNNNGFTHLSAPLPPYGTTMSALSGNNPNGNWYLFVQDDQTFNSGLVSNGWVLAVTTANPIGAVADDYLTMSASPTNLLVDGDTIITINLTNVGPSIATNVQVFDSLPLGFTYVSSTATMGSVIPAGQDVTWNVGTLGVSASAQASLTIEAGSQGTAINAANVSSITPDQNPSDGFASVTLNVTTVTSPVVSGAVATGGKFYLTVSGTGSVVIQASTNLVSWVNIYTNTPPFTFTDTISSPFSYRFYRAMTQ